MIISHDDIEYSGVISDVILHLKTRETFVLLVWVDGSEVPFEADEEAVIEFLHESLKISYENQTVWILYGIIMCFMVKG